MIEKKTVDEIHEAATNNKVKTLRRLLSEQAERLAQEYEVDLAFAANQAHTDRKIRYLEVTLRRRRQGRKHLEGVMRVLGAEEQEVLGSEQLSNLANAMWSTGLPMWLYDAI